MDRVYGDDQRCCVCGSLSSIGFLYQCKQDNQFSSIGGPASQKTGKSGQVKLSLRTELEKSGLSESGILGAEKGHYTTQQLEKLKQLKRELQHTITDVEQAEQANGAIARLMEMSITSRGTEDVDSLPISKTGNSACTYKACHACRPRCLDRVYTSFQTAFTESPRITQADISKLPIKSAAIIRNMNTKGQAVSKKKPLRSSPPSLTSPPHSTKPDPLEHTFNTTQSDISQSMLLRRHRHQPPAPIPKPPRQPFIPDPTRRTSLRRTQGFKTAVQGIFRYHWGPAMVLTSTTPPTSAPTITPPPTTTSPTGTLDITALRLARREKMRRQLLAHETTLHRYSKPVQKHDMGRFNVVRADAVSVKVHSRFCVYAIDEEDDEKHDDDDDEAKDADMGMGKQDADVVVEVRRVQGPGGVVLVAKGERSRMAYGVRDGGGAGTGVRRLMAQV